MTHGRRRSPRSSRPLVNGRGGACVGAWRWWQVEPSRDVLACCAAPGRPLRVVQALVAGVLAALGFDPDDGLYWLYALLPSRCRSSPSSCA